MTTTFTAQHRGGNGEPLVCLHGFTDTWRTWELVLPTLEQQFDVLAPTLAGHTGAAPIPDPATGSMLADAVEQAMDEAGWDTAHVVGNSLGGYVALQLAERGRARSVVALAPAGGWVSGDDSPKDTLQMFVDMKQQLQMVAPHADSILATDEGRQLVAGNFCERWQHIPVDLLAHMMLGAATCQAVEPLVANARANGWPLDPSRVTCPLRIVWGAQDRILPWPRAAEKFRNDWFPAADWVELDNVGHCPQLDVPVETAQLVLGFIGA